MYEISAIILDALHNTDKPRPEGELVIGEIIRELVIILAVSLPLLLMFAVFLQALGSWTGYYDAPGGEAFSRGHGTLSARCCTSCGGPGDTCLTQRRHLHGNAQDGLRRGPMFLALRVPLVHS